ncbi:copper homeostasis protein CutC [Flaviaesturariibacter amylovorans]|uniref:PF03932 family protein CutC n=1 Tax=Flaviaesturariibacter amylovorans TaxID=1084520 RepID=A0ABP8GUI4_9BACT
MSTYTIEIATTDIPTTEAAVAGGADRIELCSALSEGGLTPSHGVIRSCRDRFNVALFPIIRPRGGDFLYSDDELAAMLTDVQLCKALGCDGVVLGALDASGNLPLPALARLVNAAYPMEVTFHRAFDRCRDPFAALEQLIELGVQRILTSGQQRTAPEGAALIRQLREAADERIVLMPGSGVRADNIKALAEATGCTEFHSSLRGRTESGMQFRHPSFADTDFVRDAIDAAAVRELRNALES